MIPARQQRSLRLGPSSSSSISQQSHHPLCAPQPVFATHCVSGEGVKLADDVTVISEAIPLSGHPVEEVDCLASQEDSSSASSTLTWDPPYGACLAVQVPKRIPKRLEDDDGHFRQHSRDPPAQKIIILGLLE